VVNDSNNHIKSDHQSVQNLIFKDEDLLMIVELVVNLYLTDRQDEIHANVPELEEVVPKIGMEFETEQKTYDFYKNYARAIGLSIRKSKGYKDGMKT
ncbi:hypothetical protein SO802_034483, partial [Lithocarpus litseifolius]